MSRSIDIGGERYLALETVAEVFHVDSVVLEEAFSFGLLDACVERESRILVAVSSLDRVATIVRMRVVLGVELDVVDLMLGRRPGRGPGRGPG